MMRFLIITYDEYINIPFIEEYERALEAHECTYDVILWDRRELKRKPESNWRVFHAPVGKSKISKVLPFIQWRAFARKILNEGNYDKVIVLTTLPAVLLYRELLRNYSGQYWLDIRDFTYESFTFYKKIVGSLVTHSAYTSISSPAFSVYLPQSKDLIYSHNMLNLDMLTAHCSLGNRTSYRIGFVGGIRYFAQNKKLISALKNSDHFQLKYVGKHHKGCDLEKFCRDNHILNVEFFPEYNNRQKAVIYNTIDLINAVYGCDSEVERLALPNKLYDCVIFKKPIIVSKGTYLAEIVSHYHLGIAIDLDKDPLEEILTEYLKCFNGAEFDAGCQKFLELATIEMKKYRQAIEQFCIA